ncbi:general substrate transporter [Rhexocercosporidium sp. MPI-PUGE-AT-0058]|nr:general substrate transporter [Rhexocercosporidium sp. MPI-PUGE-AT-0058]
MAIIKFGGKPITGYNILIIAFATFGSITYGYCSAIIGSTLGQPSFLSYFGLDTASNAPALFGAINGLFQGGGLVGTLSFGFVADRLGRCKALFCASLLAIIGGGLQAGSVHLAMFLVARFITGFAVGGLVMIVPLWQSEVAPPHARGLLVGLHGVSILLGYSSSAWVGFGFYFVQVNGAQWRPPLALQCLPPLVLACGVYFIPESPRWLVEHEQHERAELILKRIYKDSSDPDHHEAMNEFSQIRAQIELDHQLPSSWSSIFTVPHYRKRAFIGFMTLIAGQLTGTTVINNYGPSLYKALGHNASGSLALSAGWLTEGLVCNAINALLLDYVGRKWLMVTGLVGCAISLMGVSIMVALYGGTTNTGGNSAGVFFLYLHLTFYATCMDASTYVYGSEIWPTHLRGKGFAISCAGLFVGSLTLLEAAPTAFETIGWRFYLIMMAFTIVCAVIFAVYFPETKGLSLEEISALFGDKVAPGAAHDEVITSIDSEGEKAKTSNHSVA